jgi:DNA-binding PadR family transcriptional regulator
MNIKHVMLGLLSLEPMTGYDIKKAMQKSPLTYWTGNNSQIYRALAELQDDDLVTAEVIHAGAAPTKKRYTITNWGRQELRDLSLAFPELPELRKPFLLQLSFGRDLSRENIEDLLNRYEGELKGLLLTLGDQALPEESTEFESALRRLIAANVRKFYEDEIDWVREVRREALPLAKTAEVQREAPPLANTYEKTMEKGDDKMEYKSVNKEGKVYIIVTGGQIRGESDGSDLVAACAGQGTNLLMLPEACFSEEFFRVSTQVAGMVLQKFANYNIRAAAVLDVRNTHGNFKNFLDESNRGTMFRAYANIDDAEKWLLGEG